MAELVVFVLFLIFGAKCLSHNNYYNISSRSWTIICLMIVCVILSSLVNGINVWVLIRISTLLGGIFVASVIPKERFFEVFENVIVFIAAYSLIVYIISLISPALLHLFPTMTNTAGFMSYNLLFTAIPFDSNRLFGPFREPGVYIVFLSIAIFLHFLRNEKLIIWKLVVLIAAIILSFSTAGYVVIGSLILFYVLKGRRKLGFSGVLFLIIFAITFFLLWTKTDFLSSEGDVFSKLDTDNMGRASTISRFGSIYANMAIARDYPIFGVGERLGGMFPAYCFSIFGFPSDHNTNTFLIQFATFGILFGLLFVYGFWAFLNGWKLSRPCLLIGIACFFLMFSGENLSENIIVYIFIGYGLNSSQYEIKKDIPQARLMK